MRILIVATKSPHPACDGGRLALWHTVRGLADAGHELTLVAPAEPRDHSPGFARDLPYRRIEVAARPRAAPAAVLDALVRGRSLGVARHALAAVRAAVADVLEGWRPHVVHAEQLHAFANCAPALARSIPVVLRMQNVESGLREQQALRQGPRPAWRAEASRLRGDEREAIARAACTVTLTADDAVALRALQPRAQIVPVAPAFPARLPAGPALEGEPAIALAGSAGWWPNADGERWLLREVWPLVAARLPRARLHCFGGDGSHQAERVQRHRAPADSVAAFPRDAIAVVPLHAASGIRMRILEAWARGLPVVATPVAAQGLAVAHGRELLLADSPARFAEAIAHVHADAVLRAALVAGGAAALRRDHDVARQTRALLDVYDAALATP